MTMAQPMCKKKLRRRRAETTQAETANKHGANFNSKPVEINKPLHSKKTRMNRTAQPEEKKRDTESNETTWHGSHSLFLVFFFFSFSLSLFLVLSFSLSLYLFSLFHSFSFFHYSVLSLSQAVEGLLPDCTLQSAVGTLLRGDFQNRVHNRYQSVSRERQADMDDMEMKRSET